MRSPGPRGIALLGALYLASQLAIAYILHPLGPREVLRAQTSLSPAVVEETFGRWRAAGLLDRYAAHYWLDFAHPLLYATFLAAALAWLVERNGLPPRWRAVLALPVVAALCDLFENASHLAFLANEANLIPAWVLASGVAAIAKWALAGASVLLIAVLAIRTRSLRVGGTR